MKRRLLPLFFFLLGLALLFPGPAASVNMTAACHCFRDRTFNPADPFSSDAYLLTTVFNSLLAEHFDIAKRQIILMKMQGGTSNSDLLIALHTAAQTGSDVDRLLALKKNRTWRDVLGEQPVSPDAADGLLHQIRSGMPDEQAADLVMEKMISERFVRQPGEIEALKEEGLEFREIVLLLTLADHSGTDPASILAQHRQNGLSWSAIAHNFGL
ncbi:MAG TPA: hypothetical protein ENN06_07165, partial [Desulfobacteraceae bacterium]|nr:hypothetical protein [Desulfobacteraceae bacterium]